MTLEILPIEKSNFQWIYYALSLETSAALETVRIMDHRL